jgi:hypothetical protein
MTARPERRTFPRDVLTHAAGAAGAGAAYRARVEASGKPVADWAGVSTQGWAEGEREERAAQATVLRDLFGNPFRPVTFAPSWRTPNVLRLAESIYRERAFDELPVLADLLEEEAGANDAQLLGHLRVRGGHHLGCFALDAVLGKE